MGENSENLRKLKSLFKSDDLILYLAASASGLSSSEGTYDIRAYFSSRLTCNQLGSCHIFYNISKGSSKPDSKQSLRLLFPMCSVPTTHLDVRDPFDLSDGVLDAVDARVARHALHLHAASRDLDLQVVHGTFSQIPVVKINGYGFRTLTAFLPNHWIP